jgi:hypothetical protein
MPVVKDTYRGSREYGLAYSILIAAAHTAGMVTYESVARITGLPQRGAVMANRVGRLVGEISEDEVIHGRPMLSAVVVEKNTGLPGKGFFKLAQDLKIFHGQSRSAKKTFLSKEKRKLYDLWK